MLSSAKCFFSELAALPDLVRASGRELKDLRSLTGGSMLAALNVILNQFTIFFTQYLRLSFTFLAIAASGMLYGPVLTGSIGAIVDILKYFTRNDGGAFFPGFTINEFISGFLYGVFLYKKHVTLATKSNGIAITVEPISAYSMIKNVVMLPIETGLLYVVLKKVSELRLQKIA